jgi:hypothetical protein
VRWPWARGKAAADGWQFEDAQNTAVITTWPVLDGREPILLVTHDEDDGGWQFLGGTVDEASAAVVGLGKIVARDPSVAELHDLPLGWRAWRPDARSAWRRERR